MLKKQKPPETKPKPRRGGLIEALLAMPEARLAKHEWRRAFGDRPRTFRTSHFRRWQLQEAKAKFSEVFDRAFKEGPQVVTRRNKEGVVILPEEQFRKLADGGQKPEPGMLETLLKCPKGPELKIPPRDKRDNVLNMPPVFD